MDCETKPCWRIRYYFRKGNRRRLLCGEFCGCLPGENRKAAIAAIIDDIELDKDCTLVKVTATKPQENHYCFVNAA